jgi:SAM-dependent methyltransferase
MTPKQMNKPKHKKEWFDDESFWREFYPFMFSERRFAETAELSKQLIKLVKPKGKYVLDLCCGPGRYSLALAKRGFKVTGVDKTAFLLNKARAKAKTAGKNIEWIHQDMRDFIRPNAFNLVINMFTSFGFFDDKDDDMLVLRNVFASLRPGGFFVIDTIGKERLARILVSSAAEPTPDGGLILRRHEVFDDWTRMRNEWIFIKNGKARTYSFHHTIYSGQELRDRLEKAGFVDIKLYGNLQGDSYGPKSERLIAVGKKPC